jgi:hypothetical protein
MSFPPDTARPVPGRSTPKFVTLFPIGCREQNGQDSGIYLYRRANHPDGERSIEALERRRSKDERRCRGGGDRGRYRWTICTLLFFITTINYMDRQVIGVRPTYRRWWVTS